MKNQRIIILVVVLLVAGTILYAQSSVTLMSYKDPVKRAEKLTGLMKEKLALTDNQYTSILALNIETAKKMQPILFSGSTDWYAMAEQAMPIAKDRRKKLAQLLTAEQNQKLTAIKKDATGKVLQLLAEWQKPE